MHTQPPAAHGESSPFYLPMPADSMAPSASEEWITLTPEELSAARKRLADARAAHDHGNRIGCAEHAAAYDLLARVRAPMTLTDPATLTRGSEMWNRP
jgi:hypothetical protein